MGQGTTSGSASGGGAGPAAAEVGRPRGGARAGRRTTGRGGQTRARAGRGGGPAAPVVCGGRVGPGRVAVRGRVGECGSRPADPLGLSGAALCRVPRCGHSAKKFRGSFNPKDEKKF